MCDQRIFKQTHISEVHFWVFLVTHGNTLSMSGPPGKLLKIRTLELFGRCVPKPTLLTHRVIKFSFSITFYIFLGMKRFYMVLVSGCCVCWTGCSMSHTASVTQMTISCKASLLDRCLKSAYLVSSHFITFSTKTSVNSFYKFHCHFGQILWN